MATRERLEQLRANRGLGADGPLHWRLRAKERISKGRAPASTGSFRASRVVDVIAQACTLRSLAGEDASPFLRCLFPSTSSSHRKIDSDPLLQRRIVHLAGSGIVDILIQVKEEYDDDKVDMAHAVVLKVGGDVGPGVDLGEVVAIDPI